MGNLSIKCWIVLAAAVCSNACGVFRQTLDHNGGTVCVQEGTPQVLVDAVEEAALGWSNASDGRIQLNVRVTDNDDGCGAYVVAGVPPDDEARATTWYGPFEKPDITVNVFAHFNPDENMVVCVAHELGHAMGADHSEWIHDTMYDGKGFSFAENWPPTQADIDQIVE